jgi:hypothetical protein
MQLLEGFMANERPAEKSTFEQPIIKQSEPVKPAKVEPIKESQNDSYSQKYQ